MGNEALDEAFGRIETALSRVEAAANRQVSRPGSGAGGAELEALQKRHGELKKAVAAGLRQLDEILAGLPR